MSIYQYISNLSSTLPNECRDKDLAQLKIFGGLSNISRRRKKGLMPPCIEIAPERYITLKQDILSFITARYRDPIPAKEDSFLSTTDEFPLVTEYHAVCPHTLKEGYENNRMLTKDCFKEGAPDTCNHCGTLDITKPKNESSYE